jgi:hypothetical protein
MNLDKSILISKTFLIHLSDEKKAFCFFYDYQIYLQLLLSLNDYFSVFLLSNSPIFINEILKNEFYKDSERKN